MTPSPPPGDPEPPKKTRWWVRLLEGLVALTVLALVVRYLWSQLEQLDTGQVHFRIAELGISFVLGLGASLLLVVILAGYFSGLGHPVGARNGLVLATLPRLGKYLPGKVHSVLGLAYLAHRLCRIPARVGVSVAVLMFVLSVAVAVVTSAMLIPFTPFAWPWGAALGAAAVCCLVALHPVVCLGPINWLLRRLRRQPVERGIGLGRVAVLATVGLVQKLGIAAGFAFLAGSMFDLPFELWPYLGMAYILATLSGFLAVFAPAGLGVQEGAMALLLALVIPADQAAALTVAARIWQTLLLLLLAGVGALALAFGPPATDAKAEP